MENLQRAILGIFALLALFGCTANPQDLAAGQKAPVKNMTGAPSSLNASAANASAPAAVVLSMEEVAKHSAAADCWMAIRGVVYDLSYFASHPGGSAYVPYCGKDGTAAYDSKGGRGRPHSAVADSMLKDYEVGSLGQAVQPAQTANASGQAAWQPGRKNSSRSTREDNEWGDD